jgi:hypothetical protein
MLIDVIFVDKRDLGEADEQILRKNLDQLFRMIAGLQTLQPLQMRRAPAGKDTRHLGRECCELSMAEDRRLDGGGLDSWRAKDWPIARPEQLGTDRR